MPGHRRQQPESQGGRGGGTGRAGPDFLRPFRARRRPRYSRFPPSAASKSGHVFCTNLSRDNSVPDVSQGEKRWRTTIANVTRKRIRAASRHRSRGSRVAAALLNREERKSTRDIAAAPLRVPDGTAACPMAPVRAPAVLDLAAPVPAPAP